MVPHSVGWRSASWFIVPHCCRLERSRLDSTQAWKIVSVAKRRHKSPALLFYQTSRSPLARFPWDLKLPYLNVEFLELNSKHESWHALCLACDRPVQDLRTCYKRNRSRKATERPCTTPNKSERFVIEHVWFGVHETFGNLVISVDCSSVVIVPRTTPLKV